MGVIEQSLRFYWHIRFHIPNQLSHTGIWKACQSGFFFLPLELISPLPVPDMLPYPVPGPRGISVSAGLLSLHPLVSDITLEVFPMQITKKWVGPERPSCRFSPPGLPSLHSLSCYLLWSTFLAHTTLIHGSIFSQCPFSSYSFGLSSFILLLSPFISLDPFCHSPPSSTEEAWHGAKRTGFPVPSSVSTSA